MSLVAESPVVQAIPAGGGGACLAMGSLAGVDLDEVPLEVLERSLVAGWAEQSAHMARWLAVLAAFDRREGWAGLGYMSCPHWLGVHCGISQSTGADHLRVARRLEELPATAAAFAGGGLSYSKVRALCRVATADTEHELLELARDTSAGQLERLLAVVERQRNGGAVPEEELETRREVRTWVDADGLEHIEIVAWPEEAALIKLGIDYGRNQIYTERRAAAAAAAEAQGERPGRVEAPSRVESLGWTIAAGLARLDADPNYQPAMPYVVMITAEEGSAMVGDDGQVHLAGGLAIHPRRLRQLACEATIRLLVHGRDGDEAAPLDLGRSKRLITDKQRAALLTVFQSCDFEHCTVPARFCQWHHVEHWTRGGSTDLGNLRPMCGRHHRLAHGKDVRVVIGPRNRLVALRPDRTGEGSGACSTAGTATGTAGVSGQVRDGSELVACNLAAGVEVGDGSDLIARWAGQNIDDFAGNVIVESLLRLFEHSEGNGGDGSGGGDGVAPDGNGTGGACNSRGAGEPSRAHPPSCRHDRRPTKPSPPFREQR